MTTLHFRHRQRQLRQRAAGAVITPTARRWHPAARAAGWTLLAMTLTAFWLFGLA